MYILFEGLDRCGKSSTISYLAGQLALKRIPFITIGSKYVDNLHIPSLKGKLPDEIVYMLYWQAIRLTDIQLISPALKENTIVLGDRGLMSNLAYDWEDLDTNFKQKIDEIYLSSVILPNVVFLFDIDYDTFCLRDDGSTLLTKEHFNKIKANYEYYRSTLFVSGIDIVKIDGNKCIADMRKDVLTKVLDYLEVK